MTGKRLFKYAVLTTPYEGGGRKQRRARFKPLGDSIAFSRLFPQADQNAAIRLCKAFAVESFSRLRFKSGVDGAELCRSARLRHKNSRPNYTETLSSVTVKRPASSFRGPYSFICALGRSYIKAAGF